MSLKRSLLLATATAILATTSAAAITPTGPPAATIDLTTERGAALFGAQWRYSNVDIIDARFRAPGSDGQPSHVANRTRDLGPHAGGTDFDDSAWEIVAPGDLARRRSTGRLCFAWYRLAITVPPAADGISTAGATLVFATSVDDYAEVWVDGELQRTAGQSGGSVIAGWNAENRLVVGRGLRPGQEISIAVFAVNGPISDPTTNYIYMRAARLELYPGLPAPVALPPSEVNVDVLRLDPALDAIVPLNPKIHKLAEGFQFTEGPLWVDDGGYLLFSDPNANRIYKYDAANDGVLSVHVENSGYRGADIAEYRQPGSNGLSLDAAGRLTINQHGNRRVVRREVDGGETPLAERYDGKRLNSPNDLVYRSDGSLYFTDPPFGLPKVFDDPRKELPFSGVYRVAPAGSVELLARDLDAPNGLAFSPDEKTLYVDNWNLQRKVVMRYDVEPDGSLTGGRLFFDMTSAGGDDALDGLKVDERGNVYVSGPGGIWILSPDGVHLGTIRAPHLPANFAWGDADRRTLYLTARGGLYRMRLNVAGARTVFRGPAAQTAKR